jgi:hypothetical protein
VDTAASEFILLAREELVVFTELLTLSIFAANEEESDVTVANTLCIDDANDAELDVTVLLTLLKLDENDAEFDVIAAAREEDAKFTVSNIETETAADEADSAVMFEFAIEIFCSMDCEIVFKDEETPINELCNEFTVADIAWLVEFKLEETALILSATEFENEEEKLFIAPASEAELLDIVFTISVTDAAAEAEF